MQNPRLAARYAKSLLDLAIEQNGLEATLKDIELLNEVCRQSRDFAGMLRSPIIKADKKSAIIEAVIGSRLQPMTRAFINLLVGKGREANLPEIASSFIAQYKEMKNIRTVKITTATPINDRVKQALQAKAATSMPGAQIEVETKVNPDIIGGFVLEVGNSVVDASVRRDLNDIKKQFTQNMYVSQLN